MDFKEALERLETALKALAQLERDGKLPRQQKERIHKKIDKVITSLEQEALVKTID